MPALRTTGLTQSPSLRAVSRRPALVSLKAGYLDDIDPKKGVQYDAKGKQLMPDADYAGFIDGDGFDGGDGQVGVVGDGDNAMEKFDNRITVETSFGAGQARGVVTGGSSGQRVDKRWNAWGSESADDTFKENLREEGIEDIDIYGNDKKEVQRQQYENWANQQRQWSKERATRDADADRGAEKRQKGTVEYFDHLNSGADSNKLTEKDLENMIFATGAKGFDNTAILKKNDWKPCAAGTRIDGEYTCMAGGLVTFTLEPNSMVSEQFIARFTDDSANDFVVAAESYDIGKKEIRGELPRRGTGVEFTLRYNPPTPIGQPEYATLVVDAEDGWKWTFKIEGRH